MTDQKLLEAHKPPKDDGRCTPEAIEKYLEQLKKNWEERGRAEIIFCGKYMYEVWKVFYPELGTNE